MPAVLQPGPTTPPDEQPHPPKIYSDRYKGVTVDTRYVPTTALLTHVEGSPLMVNYYAQVINRDSEVAGQNVTRSPTIQQYLLIKGMEIRVAEALKWTQNDETKQFSATGSANVYPFLTPNVGDMFLMDVGSGREGIMQVTDTRRLSVFEEAIHEIDFAFVSFSDQDQLRLADLNTKTVQSYTYAKDFLQYGQNPVLLDQDAANVAQLKYAYADIVRQYFKEFLSNEFKTLIIPGQAWAVYDHFVTQFMLKFCTTIDAPEIQYCRLLNVDGVDDMKTPTFWDMCLQRNEMLKRMINMRMSLTASLYFPSDPMMEGVHHSGVQYLMFPKTPRQSWDDVRKMKSSMALAYTLNPVPSIVGSLDDLITDATLTGLTDPNLPLIKDVLVDDYYVFSEAFYNQDRPNMSQLEAATWDMLDRKTVSLSLLTFLVSTWQTWGALERFYYTPVVLMLIRSQIKSL
jgi:hypothetical protein